MADQHPLDAYRLPNLHDFRGPDRFDEVDSILEKAKKVGAIAPLPRSELEVRPKELHESRIRTIRTRLYLLNYLARDNQSPEINDKLRQAIHRFQADAGLTQDGWVGPETWTALQELVSFEHPSNLAGWFNGHTINPALLRAIKLRLFVLGFLPSKQAKGEKKLQHALGTFVLVARTLKLHDTLLSPRLELATINLLFDQDRIAERLAQAGETFVIQRSADLSKKKVKEIRAAVRRFVICCAKIELWLLGYTVPIDGTAKFETPPQGRYSPGKYPLYKALHAFWLENGQSKKNARKLAAAITGRFFGTLLRVQQEGERILDPNHSDQCYEMIVKEDETVLEQVWGHVKTIGSRIWDGIKRVWRWFKLLLKKVGRKIGTWTKNIARLVYRYALNAFPIVTQIAKVTKETISFLWHKTLQDSDIGHIVISRDNDFDYRVYVNPNRDREIVEEILERFQARAHIFSVGMRLLGVLIDALISVIARGGLVLGWFGLVLALVRIYSRIKELGDVLEEEQAFLAIV